MGLANKKSKRIIELEKSIETLLKRVGYTGKYKDIPVNEIPQYRNINEITLSNNVPVTGVKKKENKYTGTEILGIATMSKSNAIPIRKDNVQSAIDVANMRRN